MKAVVYDFCESRAGEHARAFLGEFLAVQLPPQAAAQSTAIHLEMRRGASTVTASWPLQGASQCAAWLREWLR